MPTEKIKVMTGVPLPIVDRGRPYKYPFDEMDVGQSFQADASYQTLHSCIRAYRNRHPTKTFKIEKIGKKKVHVWRVT
jgi:hypothetical protein